MTARFQVIGINDKRDFCECCGKSGLARVVWILDTDTGEEKHFGTSCAAAPAKGFDVAKEIRAAIRTYDAAMQIVYRRARIAYKALGAAFETVMDGSVATTRPADSALWARLVSEQVR